MVDVAGRPQPRVAHALMHAPSNIDRQPELKKPPTLRNAHSDACPLCMPPLLGERGVGAGSADRWRALAHDDRLVQVAGQGGRAHSGAPGGPSGPRGARADWQHAACSGGLRSAGPARLNGSFERAVSG